jgi:hypothetical protein
VVHIATRVVADGVADVFRDGGEVRDQLGGGFRFKLWFAGDGVVEIGDVCLMVLRVSIVRASMWGSSAS